MSRIQGLLQDIQITKGFELPRYRNSQKVLDVKNPRAPPRDPKCPRAPSKDPYHRKPSFSS